MKSARRPRILFRLGVGVPKDECFVSKGIAKRGWEEEESQIGAKDKMIVYQHDVSV